MMIRKASATNNCLRVYIGRGLKPNRASQHIIMTHKVERTTGSRSAKGYVYEPETMDIRLNIHIYIISECLGRKVYTILKLCRLNNFYCTR